MTTLVVIGGGISGLAAAWFAADEGYEVTVLEQSGRLGGKLCVTEVGGVPVDVGAEAILTIRPEGVDLLRRAGLYADRVAPLTTAAQVRAGGANHPLPPGTMFGIPGSVEAVRAAGVLTPAGLAALAAEPSRDPLPPLTSDLPVGRLVRDRLGDEVLERVVEPLLGGVYAGRADALSLRATMAPLAARLESGGSLLAAVAAVAGTGTRAPDRPVFTSIRGGLGRLPVALADAGRFDVRTGVTVRAIRRTPTGFALECGAVRAGEVVEADAVVVAVPAAKAARLLGEVAPGAATELAGIDSASVAIVTFAFESVALPEGSGLLVGSGERFATKAITLSSQKWPLGVAGSVFRASVGRIGEPAVLQLEDRELIELVRRELRPLLGVEAAPLDANVTRWGGGLPQYAVGHVERIARVRAALAAVRGLAACGAAFDGVGVPACVASARAAVDRVTATVPAKGQ